MVEKVTRILHSQGLNRAKYDRLADMAARAGGMRADAWRRCSGVSTAAQTPYAIRDAWMAEDCDWRLGKATLADALGDIAAAREAAKVSVGKAIRHRTRGNDAERQRLYGLLKQNRWTEDPFLHRQMRNQWRGGRSHVTNQVVADSGSYTTKVWHGRAWLHLQSMERGQRIAIPLKGHHLPTGTLRIILQDNGEVAVHHAIDETQACSIKPGGSGTVGVDKAGTLACEDLSASMKSAKYRHKDTNRRLNGWVKGVMADTPTSISRRRGSALALVNPAYTSQIDSRTIVAGTSFSVPTGLCWTRTPMPPATFRRGCTTRRLRCPCPTGRLRPCSPNEPGCRWGLPAPDSSCGGVPQGPHQPRAKYPRPYRTGRFKGTAIRCRPDWDTFRFTTSTTLVSRYLRPGRATAVCSYPCTRLKRCGSISTATIPWP
ncbi:MAG: hypothetical protein J4G06_10795 [Caldilineaceae bacterium]|nr:hypothetical protein [Caldilineaceae bacterium]